MIFRLISVLFVFLSVLTSAHAKAFILPASDIGISANRVALVMGNADYENISVLDNTVNDAHAIAKSLTNVGFKVHRVENSSLSQMNSAISEFLDDITTDSEALIYYAGHAVEVDGQNFLLPTDIASLKPSQKRNLIDDAISLTLLLDDLKQRGARVNLVMLDACRDNPFAEDGTNFLGREEGLGRIVPPKDTFVLYSAAAGQTALDRLHDGDVDPNGVFTRYLLELIETPGLEIRSIAIKLKEQVYVAALAGAEHDQRPSYYDDFIGQFFFLPKDQQIGKRNSCELNAKPSATLDAILLEDQNIGINACQQAIVLFPDNTNYPKLLSSLEEQRSARKAILSDNEIYSKAYLKLYPAGRYALEIKKHYAILNDGEEYSALNETVQPVPELHVHRITSKINGVDIPDGESRNVSRGDVITYLYRVTNVGNVPIDNVTLSDDFGNGKVIEPVNETLVLDKNIFDDSIDVFNDGIWDVLGAGDAIAFTGLYTVTREDFQNLADQ